MISEFESAKKLRGAYDFDDLILKTRDLLVDKATAQWVLFKLDRGIEHVLVDEAQDTSLAQWQIVSALTEEFFSGTGSREVPDRTLFVVGDRKQSIFSFQGADPAAFEASREIFGAQITNVGQPFSTVDLTVSYRSTEEVLKAVDMVFAEGTRARVGLDGIHPQNLHHESNRGGEHGLFELWPLMEADEKAEREPWQAPVDQYPPRSGLAQTGAKAGGNDQILDRKTPYHGAQPCGGSRRYPDPVSHPERAFRYPDQRIAQGWNSGGGSGPPEAFGEYRHPRHDGPGAIRAPARG